MGQGYGEMLVTWGLTPREFGERPLEEQRFMVTWWRVNRERGQGLEEAVGDLQSALSGSKTPGVR